MYKKTIIKLSAVMVIMSIFSNINVQAAITKMPTKTPAKTIIASTYATNQKTITTRDNLQSALVSGNNLLIESGTYLISSITEISSNIKVEGNTNTIIDGSNRGSFSISGLHDVEFKNITFNNLTEMTFKNSTNLKFTNCKFNNFKDNGIVLDTFDNVEFSNCIISKIGSTNVNVTWEGMGLYLVKGTNFKFHDSEISNTYGHAAIFLTSTNFEIKNNKLHDTFYRAIELYEDGNSGIISNNNIYNAGSINTTDSGVGCNGIFANGDSGNVDIISNTISNVLENAIEGQFKSIQKNIITGTGIDMKNHPTPSGEGIYLTSGKCNDNTIKNSKGPAIKGYSEDTIYGVEINGNKLINCIGSDYAVDMNSEVGYSNIKITNNVVYSTPGSVGLRDKPRVKVVVSKNVVMK